MFEQSILAAQSQKRTWPVVASLFSQTTLILLATLIPLIYTDHLPGLSNLAQKLIAPSPPPAPSPAPEPQTVARPAAVALHRFTMPTSIPQHAVNIHDDFVQSTLDPGPVGVVGASGPAVSNPLAQLLTTMTVPRPPEPVTPVKPAAAREPMRVSKGVQEAKVLRRILPVYPPLAIATRTQGTVHLLGIIATDGTIKNLQVIDGHPLLVRAAVDAVKQWIYKPTLLSGEPVEVIAPIEVTFTLNR